jgi:hypothetical protein
MRQINWDQRLSDDDVTWLRQSGMRFAPDGRPLEDAIRDNLGKDWEQPTGSGGGPGRSVLDPTATGAQPFASLSADEQRERLGGDQPSDDDDDYDQWKKDELVAEIEDRNKDRDEPMSTAGTKAELIARLRADDQAE